MAIRVDFIKKNVFKKEKSVISNIVFLFVCLFVFIFLTCDEGCLPARKPTGFY